MISLTDMAKQKFQFETKCKLCDFINSHEKEIIVQDESYLLDYLLFESIKVISPGVYVNMFDCKGCNKFTVQEFISVQEVK